MVHQPVVVPLYARLIGKEGPINWLPRNCYFNTLGIYFFWGRGDIVHSERIESLPDVRRRIIAALTAVLVGVLSRVWGEVEFRFNVRRAVSGNRNELR
jgi:hypothetical protein